MKGNRRRGVERERERERESRRREKEENGTDRRVRGNGRAGEEG